MANQQIFTSTERPFPHYNLRSYRIEIDISDPHRILQRHIWTDNAGAVDAEDWIRSTHETAESLTKRGYTRVEA